MPHTMEMGMEMEMGCQLVLRKYFIHKNDSELKSVEQILLQKSEFTPLCTCTVRLEMTCSDDGGGNSWLLPTV